MTKRSYEPHNRLTRLGNEMANVLEAKGDEASDVRAVILLSDEEGGGATLYGYEGGDKEALVDIIGHLTAIFEANGMQMLVQPLHGNPGTN